MKRPEYTQEQGNVFAWILLACAQIRKEVRQPSPQPRVQVRPLRDLRKGHRQA